MEPLEEDIRIVAYQLYEERQRTIAKLQAQTSMDDWLRARQLLRTQRIKNYLEEPLKRALQRFREVMKEQQQVNCRGYRLVDGTADMIAEYLRGKIEESYRRAGLSLPSLISHTLPLLVNGETARQAYQNGCFDSRWEQTLLTGTA